jgi:hypothetical protein
MILKKKLIHNMELNNKIIYMLINLIHFKKELDFKKKN